MTQLERWNGVLVSPSALVPKGKQLLWNAQAQNKVMGEREMMHEPVVIGYGKTIEWTDFDGSKSRVSTHGHASAAEAIDSALRMAEQSGWTPPRWWQLWRWSDTRRRPSPDNT